MKCTKQVATWMGAAQVMVECGQRIFTDKGVAEVALCDEHKGIPWAHNVICLGWDEVHQCNGGNPIPLTYNEYMAQMSRPDATWRCPICKCEAVWDDESYDEWCSYMENQHKFVLVKSNGAEFDYYNKNYDKLQVGQVVTLEGHSRPYFVKRIEGDRYHILPIPMEDGDNLATCFPCNRNTCENCPEQSK